MKFKGEKLTGRNTDVLVLFKDGKYIVFRAEALMSYKEFDKICPMPKPPVYLKRGGSKQQNEKDPKYLEAMEKYAEQRVNYMMIKTLAEISCYTQPDKSDLEIVEWETVDLEKPETYGNWQKELEESGFSEMERMRVMQLCSQVNALDDNMLSLAKEDFLAEAPQQDQ